MFWVNDACIVEINNNAIFINTLLFAPNSFPLLLKLVIIGLLSLLPCIMIPNTESLLPIVPSLLKFSIVTLLSFFCAILTPEAWVAPMIVPLLLKFFTWTLPSKNTPLTLGECISFVFSKLSIIIFPSLPHSYVNITINSSFVKDGSDIKHISIASINMDGFFCNAYKVGCVS